MSLPDQPALASPPPANQRGGLGRGFVRFIIGLCLLGGLTLAGGFLWFADAATGVAPAVIRSVDGIVVLTGGSSRVADAMDLLAAGHGKRLLITGVHQTTTRRDIKQLVPQHAKLVNCCVDLDYSALNTLGNAAQARRWAKEKGFRSLIVVTSSYHMPRSMAELRRRLPNIELTPFPVASDRVRDPWWSSLPTTRLLMSEYLKFILAHVRMRIESDHDATEIAHTEGGSKG